MAEEEPAAAADILDRSRFEEAFEVTAVRVPPKRTGQFLKKLKGHLLNLPRRKNVEAVAGEAANLILLSRELTGGISQLPPPEKQWLEEQVNDEVRLTNFTVHLGYDYFNVEDILAKLLPAGVPVPSSFEQAGHLCHLNLRESQLPYRFLIAQVILDKNKSLRTVVNKVGKIETEFRTFPMEHLAGDEDTMVKLNEQGCVFEFDFRDVYWNSRLQAEHGRLVEALFFTPNIDEASSFGPFVADATCGVGPFSIPMAKRGSGLVTHANDLNPQCIRWLRHNAEANRLPEILEAQEVPAFADGSCNPPDVDSRLVIHAPGDARAFIRALYARKHPITHAIFNLPATGIELLDCYRGLSFEEAGLPRPLVVCYTFSDGAVDDEGPEGCAADLLGRLSAALALPRPNLQHAAVGQLPLPAPQVQAMVQAATDASEQALVSIRLVRNVSPTRNMFCVCFRVPLACATAALHAEKRVRVA